MVKTTQKSDLDWSAIFSVIVFWGSYSGGEVGRQLNTYQPISSHNTIESVWTSEANLVIWGEKVSR